ncbi:MAG: hypothetical protein O7G32_04390, partial [SAR324 cluster bacterium]|nr:hypothetical protein [SAR324 cluster bacterium]
TFPTGNSSGISGFRIQVTKDLDPTQYPTFTALGRLDMGAQFDSNYVAGVSGATLPTLLMYTISDVNGIGAAIASFSGAGISFDLSSVLLGHLGHYLFTKDDRYFFDGQLQAEWINKDFTVATFQDSAARTTNTGNLGIIESFLASQGLPAGYFAASCNATGDNCEALLDAIFAGGGYGHEANFGSDPGDQRSTIINAIGAQDYLGSVCPGDVASPCPVETFDHTFTPTN